MSTAIVSIVVALIGGPLMWLLHRLDKRNSEQHKDNLDTLYDIRNRVDDVNNKITHHIEWHLDQTNADSDS